MATNFQKRSFETKAVQKSTGQRIKDLTEDGTPYFKRFVEVIRDKSKASKFLASVVSVTNDNSYLQKAEPASILGAAMVAASLDLEVVPSLGFSAIVPYADNKTGKTYAQFQIMRRGWVQLAQRTGLYESAHVKPVYADEYGGEDPYTDEPILLKVNKATCMKSQDEGNEQTKEDCIKAGIVGYMASFKLTNGFKKALFWDIEKIDKHARRYSASYRSDVARGTASSWWRKDFPRMAEKTVLKSLLMNWGPLSSSFVTASEGDQKIYTDTDAGVFMDNPQGVEIEAEEAPIAPVDDVLAPDAEQGFKAEEREEEFNPFL